MYGDLVTNIVVCIYSCSCSSAVVWRHGNIDSEEEEVSNYECADDVTQVKWFVTNILFTM